MTTHQAAQKACRCHDPRDALQGMRSQSQPELIDRQTRCVWEQAGVTFSPTAPVPMQRNRCP